MTSRARSARSPPIWDPHTVLNLDITGRCLGWARTCKRTCRNAIAAHNQGNAEFLLKVLSSKQPDACELEDDLYRLAGFLLCVRWHQGQADNLVAQWSAHIDRFVIAQEEEQAAERSRQRRIVRNLRRSPSIETESSAYSHTSSRSSRTSSGHARSSSPASSTTPSSTTSTRSRPSRSQHPTSDPSPTANAAQIAQLEAAIAALTAQVSSLRQAIPATTEAATSRSQSSSSASVVATASTTHTSRSHSPSRSPSTPPSPHSRSNSSSSTTSTTSTATITSTSSSPCTISHVRRRAIDDECPICREEFLQDEQLVWCKDSCGRSFHNECFEGWSKSCSDLGRTVTCVMCRTDWGSECGCA